MWYIMKGDLKCIKMAMWVQDIMLYALECLAIKKERRLYNTCGWNDNVDV